MNIKRYAIFGLHGDKDVQVDFEGPYKIIVAENGTGKTTVLNSLFYLLTDQFIKLSAIEFDRLILEFENKFVFELTKDEIAFAAPEVVTEHPKYNYLAKYLGPDVAKDLMHHALRSDDYTKSNMFRYAAARYHGPTTQLRRLLDEIRSEISNHDLFSEVLSEKRENLKDLIDYDVFYLPTYRRVEEDLQSLGYAGEFSDGKEQLIHFGMQDVTRRFRKITKEIVESAATWYSKISGRMLDELMTGLSVDREKLHKISNPDALGIVLDRIGKNISKESKSDILSLVESGSVYDEKHTMLAYFLSNLIDIYEKQREKDNKIKEFVGVASKYLVEKEIVYDESQVSITVINKRTGREVELEKLSSGEKQLISIFSKLYLEDDGPYFIIFDEPELSLSIEWQKDLLPDIIESGQCQMLMAATHSPFVFENKLDMCAEALQVRYRDE